MADNAQENRQIALRIDESKMQAIYSNTIRTTTMQDEVVLDFGINMPMQGPDNQPFLVFNVGSRIIMNWAGAKRLAINLVNVIQQYEQRNGEISLGPAQQGGGPRLTQ
ncbi:MAG: DUF3467 domain-containing protein [Planctomycetota bacterium]|jgi:hypothetical protein|nr:DUF3467 domain-containing protein [Planctomycetota bacterium]